MSSQVKSSQVVNIALLGASSKNANMGCMALTYSLLLLLREIENSHNYTFHYFLFDGQRDQSYVCAIAEKLNINPKNICSCSTPPRRLLSLVRHPINNLKFFLNVFRCSFAIDMTFGDSFSDIYGVSWFNYTTSHKLLIEKLGIPMILGPQTYGPYTEASVPKAVKAIKNAAVVMSRDKPSIELVQKIAGITPIETTDIAFLLPYEHKHRIKNAEKVKLGINISGLLVDDQTEKTPVGVELKTHYDDYISNVIKTLVSSGQYEIHLISHVSADYVAIQRIKHLYPYAVVPDMFCDPIEAKTYISGMDIFIGSRMHATIAAFSTGVAVIPAGYSRKFTGLFESLGYKRVIDFQNLQTEEAVNLTLNYVNEYKNLQEEAQKCMEVINTKLAVMKSTFENVILNILR